jgi:hypothetical protein
MIDATAKLRLESDELAPWIAECCVTGPVAGDIRVQSSKLYGNHDQWRRRNGLHPLQGGNKAFKKRMEEKGFFTRPINGCVFWYGIRVREPEEFFEDEPNEVASDEATSAAEQPPTLKPISKTTTPEELDRIPGAGRVI